MGIKLALPILAVEFLVNVSLNIMARAIPQLDVFILGYSVKIPLGLMILAAILPVMCSFITGMFGSRGQVYQHLKDFLMIINRNPS